jgi:hypothetical protein
VSAYSTIIPLQPSPFFDGFARGTALRESHAASPKHATAYSVRRLGAGGDVKTALDILIAPRDAFARIRETPVWVWPLAIAIVIGSFSVLALLPALKHALETGLPAQLAATPQFAKLPPDLQQKQIATVVALQLQVVNFTWLFTIVVVPLVAAVQALVMLVAAKIGGGDRGYKHFWSLAVHVQIAGSVGGLLADAIVLLRGANSFDAPDQLQTVLPNLALLVPGGPHVLVAFFGALNIVTIWQCALLAFGMIAVGRIPRPVAWTAAILMLLTVSVFAAIGAAAQHAA